VDRSGAHEDLPNEGRPEHALPDQFNKTSSITTGVCARIECLSPAGIWTQVPARASFVSSPRPTVASPRTKNSSAGFAAVCSESSWPRPKPKTTAFSRSSGKTERLRMPSAGGSA
jgi:hypothetical protein